MSDTPSEATPAAESPPPAAAPPPAASTPPADSAGGDPFTELPVDQALFPRSYVEKLRNEGHKYRTEAQTAAQKAAEYDQVYGRYEPEDRRVWFELANAWAYDPSQAAQMMQEIAQAVLTEGKPAEPAKAAVSDADIPIPDDLTPEKVQAMIDERIAAQQQATAQQHAVETIYQEVRGHGYDPESREGFMVLWTANNETDGDIGAAVEKMKQYRQGIIDEYVAGRSGPRPVPAPNGGVAANQSVEIGSFEDARKATDAFLRAQGAAGT